ncbi:MAG: efflux RND transporter permease subunit [Saprospiraceae bacterium]|nr:efflux RND transporter permease subunit [Saprospiraceae bacterium]
MAKNITQKIKDGLREFGLTTLAVDNSTSVFLLTFMLFLFGLQSYNTMPKESFPEIPWPKIYVNTVYFGNSAADIENLVTRPIEKELAGISEIKTVTSSSQQDYSLIVAEFEADVDQDDATRKVKDAVDRAMPDLPNDLTTEPEVLEINLSELPILTINVSGSYTNDQLREYAEYLQDRLEDLNEISSVDIKGSLEREVSIEVDLVKMQSLQISFSDIENAVRSENVTMSGGELLTNNFRRTIRIIGEFENVEEIRNLIVKSENQLPVFLKDIAKVEMGFEDRTSIARASSLPVISLDVIKGSGENLLAAADKIKEIIAIAQKDVLPKDLEISLFNDQSVQTRLMVSNLENSIISGVILVVLVLLFFLGLRNSMFVGIAIPLSMLMGILILNLIGYTLNMVVLFSLILALGMLVDNAIVVVENVYRYLQNGYSAKDAARYGAGEVALPIIASTATTLAAFIPLAFWPGLMGSFMKYLPITLIIVLSSSLFVALVINPVLTAAFMKVDERADDAAVRKRKQRNILIWSAIMIVVSIIAHFMGIMWLRNSLWITSGVTLANFFFLRPASFWFQANALPALERGYFSFVKSALIGNRPYGIFVGTILLLIFSFILMGTNMPKVEFFPEADPLYVNAFVELPVGTDIEATDELMKGIEKDVARIIEPYGEIVEAVLSQIGENTSDPNAGPEFGASPHKARLTVSFVPSEERGELSSLEVMEKLQEGLKGYPGVGIVIAQNQNGPPTGLPINIELRGEDINELANLSEDIVSYLNAENIAGVEELKKDVRIGKPEMIVGVNREAARRYEISTYLIADAIRTAVFGKEISKFKEGDDEYPIQLRVDDQSRYDIDDILNQRITFRSPANGRISQVPIAAVADVSYSSSYTSINRKDQERMITIYSNVLEGYIPNEVVDHVKATLASYNMPSGFSYEFTGEQQEQAENMEFLSTAFMVALFGIFLIIVAQFNSIISPFIIILSIVFSTIGVLLGYVFSGMNIVLIMTGVGIISLAGIVVNNAIVLLDYINLLVKRKRTELGLDSMYDMPSEDVRAAVILGGSTRLRPVLLTAITTVLGLVPLAIGFNFNFFTLISDWDPNYYVGGDNAAFWGTMAWTVIYGLVFSTFLTLVVVPVMYWMAYQLKGAWIRFSAPKEKS